LTAVILADQAAFLSRWGRYLSAKLERPVVFLARESYQDVLDLLFARQLECAWVCGYPYVQHQDRLTLIAAPLYQGRPQYKSYLITGRRAFSGVAGWKDLAGKVLAYSDPLSNSGWLVAQSQLALAGLSPAALKKTFFAHSHRNVAEAVASRLAHAGCVDGYVWDTMVKQGMPLPVATEVVWSSEWYGFPPLVALADAAGDIQARLFSALEGMPGDEEGVQLLSALNLDGFVKVPPSLYDGIRDLARQHSLRTGRPV
jgi:phosphonate transport system substrate-binding protein